MRLVCSRGLYRARERAAIAEKKLLGTVKPRMRIVSEVGKPSRPEAILTEVPGKKLLRHCFRCVDADLRCLDVRDEPPTCAERDLGIILG